MDKRNVMPNYPPAPSTSYGEQYYIVRVANLDFGTTEATLKSFFSSCGDVHECVISRNIDTNTSRGIGHVKYLRVRDALEAARNLNGEVLDGRTLHVYLHDKALRRRLAQQIRDRAKRRCETASADNKPPAFTVKITNLNYKIDEEDLKKIFSGIGPIADIYVPRLRYTHLNRGFAFVRFHREADALYAISKLDRKEVQGRNMCLAMARLGAPPPFRKYAHGTFDRFRRRKF
ncbi:uncharacterized protein LOC659359 [Tribolium castaneum]|uniref:Heterogeneous nuclear ribonucleoprotein 87F-like Protein n=1 Tax=Tribolium castaneum TaxID=7070 RepID=D6W6I1_TRICA|nr:PREDICTED: regulator of rDNA transcription protein 5 [Tribolium castaneum]EFA11057.1 Heterogeneous nuclear ribonucleoprotein 87F-like Protein [Tribolium castaneum]|eukprot:XP_970765.1 PREDICTED: regulator of rDNA transcription protein 5 [Tribolium castaneum]